MSTGSKAYEELAGTAPRIVFQGYLMPVVFAIEIDLQPGNVHPSALLCVAFRLFDLADQA